MTGRSSRFRSFAAAHWAEHARKAGECQNEVLIALIKTIFGITEYASEWLHELGSSRYAHGLLLPNTSHIALILAAFDPGSLYGETLGISTESLVSRDINQRNPLHFAAANNAIPSVYCIKAVCTNAGTLFGEMSTQTDTKSHTPLHLAAQRGHREIIDLLLDWTHAKFSFDGEVFETFAINGYEQREFQILYDKAEIRESSQLIHILNQAATLDGMGLINDIIFGFKARVDVGLASLADLTDNRISLLHSALERKLSTVLHFLLDNEDFCEIVDRRGWTALHLAADKGNERLASQLIEKGIWINARNLQGDTALHIASRNKFLKTVRLLCDKGSVVGVLNKLGQLPAHLAAETGEEDILQLLCDRGTNVVARDIAGRTTLPAASQAGQEATVRILLAVGADVDAMDVRGRTPIHYATGSGDLTILHKVLIAGADPMATDIVGICPIHLAAAQGSELLIMKLLRFGADVNCTDVRSKTPMHYAYSSKRSTAVVKLLILSGSKLDGLDTSLPRKSEQ